MVEADMLHILASSAEADRIDTKLFRDKDLLAYGLIASITAIGTVWPEEWLSIGRIDGSFITLKESATVHIIVTAYHIEFFPTAAGAEHDLPITLFPLFFIEELLVVHLGKMLSITYV
jgi:hypothetical protein